MSKKIIIGGFVSLFSFLALGIGLLHANIIKLPIERQINQISAVDLEDDKALMGASHNVFVGKVIEEIGNKDAGLSVETQFTVEVIFNIKGNLNGRVTVEQQGGYKDGILYLVHEGDTILPNGGNKGGDALLVPGTTYLFCSRYNEKENWHTLISHPNGRKLISKDKNLSSEKLKDMSKNDEKVKKLEEAYKNEIPFDVDVANNWDYNSYKSLQKK